MLSREQFLAASDQELAMVRDTINDMVTGYAHNMEHIDKCANCQEVENVTHLVSALSTGLNPGNMPAIIAVAVKMIYDERVRPSTLDAQFAPDVTP